MHVYTIDNKLIIIVYIDYIDLYMQ